MIIDKHIDAGADAGAAWALRLSSYHPWLEDTKTRD